MNDDPQLIEALLNDYLLKYGKQIPQDVLDIPNPKDRLHAIEEFIQNNLKIKLVGREELIKNYLENQKQAASLPPEQAKARIEFLKRILTKNQHPSVLELPEMVDHLKIFGLNEENAIDLVKEIFGKELGIEFNIKIILEQVRLINDHITKEPFHPDPKQNATIINELRKFIGTTVIPVVAKTQESNSKETIFKPRRVAETAAKLQAAGVLATERVVQTINDLPYDRLQELISNPIIRTRSTTPEIRSLFERIVNYKPENKPKDSKETPIKEPISQTKTSSTKNTLQKPKALSRVEQTTKNFINTLFGEEASQTVEPQILNVAGIVFGTITATISALSFSGALLPIGTIGGTVIAVYNFVQITSIRFNIKFPSFGINSFLNSVGASVVATLSSLFLVIFTTIIFIPIAVVLILFIINNSAHVVPYDSNLYSGNPAFSNVAGSCPLENGVISCGSYGTYTPACHEGHGGNHYWTGQSSACLYSIPIGTSCKYNNNHPENACYNPSSSCSTYGYAVDVASPANTPVYLPVLNGKDLEWHFSAQYNMVSGGNDPSGSGNSNLGFGRVYTASDEENNYQLYMGHMESVSGQTILKSKQLAGNLACIGDACKSSHVHIELQINGINVIPDGLCKK